METTNDKGILGLGTLIAGRYEVVEEIAGGGTGQVVRAHDRLLNDEIVAIKLLPPHWARDETTLIRFRNEVVLARRLAHPNIVRIYDFGSAGNGYYYISMEFVEGCSLRLYIQQQPEERLSPDTTLKILFQVSIALEYAHRMGVIHRDLKPDNILMSKNGEVKLSDFGAARSTQVLKGPTGTGESIGTPYYMAPEQLRGEHVDLRADIYALGILTFEMITGDTPFANDNFLALAAMHFNYPIPKFASKDTGVSSWFQDFVETCAEKNPKHRYQTMAEVTEALHEQMMKRGMSPASICSLFCPYSRADTQGNKRLFKLTRGRS